MAVVGQLEVGGTERHLLRVLPRLCSEGLEIALFVFEPGGTLEKAFEQAGIRVLSAGCKTRAVFRSVVGLRSLYRVLRTEAPDVVHFFLPKAYLLGSLAAAMAGVEQQVMSRRSLATYHRRYPGVRWIERLLHRRMAFVVGNSRAVLEELASEGVRPPQLRLIYNGVEVHEARCLARASLRQAAGIGNASLVLITVANLAPYKGYADLIDALALAAPQLPPDWLLLCCGRDDGSRESLRQRAASRGIAGRVRWMGSVDSVDDYLAVADIAVLASHEEGFSNAVIEGMAAGLPTIVTDVGGNPEAVQHGESGLVVPPAAPGMLAAAIAQLAHDPGLRWRMGQAARRRVRECFELESVIDAYRNLYMALDGVRDPERPGRLRK